MLIPHTKTYRRPRKEFADENRALRAATHRADMADAKSRGKVIDPVDAPALIVAAMHDGRWVSGGNIGARLGRSVDRGIHVVLDAMVADGRLEAKEARYNWGRWQFVKYGLRPKFTLYRLAGEEMARVRKQQHDAAVIALAAMRAVR